MPRYRVMSTFHESSLDAAIAASLHFMGHGMKPWIVKDQRTQHLQVLCETPRGHSRDLVCERVMSVSSEADRFGLSDKIIRLGPGVLPVES